MFYLSVVCFCIWSMHPDESSDCKYVRLFFFNLHLHPNELFTKIIKIYLFLHFLTENYDFKILTKKIYFYDFDGKICVLKFWRKLHFTVLTKVCIMVLAKSSFLAGKFVFNGFNGKLSSSDFGGKLHFSDFGGKLYFSDFGRKLRFSGFGG